jgi:hypothetical protein
VKIAAYTTNKFCSATKNARKRKTFKSNAVRMRIQNEVYGSAAY